MRAHFAPGPARTDPDGGDVKACVGMVGSLIKLLHDADEHVTHLAVAFDDPIESFRNDLFAGYKSSDGIPETVLAQFDRAQAGIRALGVPLWVQDEFEADDAIASAVTQARAYFDQIRILSPDKDFGQLVDADQVVQVDRSRQRVFDAAGVVARLGVEPSQVALFLALSGDTADGIPGVPGFGAKSAQAVANHFGEFDAIPSDCAAWDLELRGRDRLCAAFREHRDAVALYLTLTTLRTDVPVKVTPRDVAFHGIPQDTFSVWCDSVGASTLKQRPQRWRSS